MAQQSSFFNANLVNGSYDRTYNASDWAAYFSSFLGNGVAFKPSTTLQVQAGTGMQVIVSPGVAFINGYRYSNTTPLTINISTANETYTRITSIVVELNLTNRDITCFAIDGVPSNNPVAPQLTQTSGVYQIQLATITVQAGVSQILQSNITDTRADSNVCGYIEGLFGQDDHAELEQQISQINENISNLQNNSLTDNSSPTLSENWTFEEATNLQFENSNGNATVGMQINQDTFMLFNNVTNNAMFDVNPVSTGTDTVNWNCNMNFQYGLTVNSNNMFPTGPDIQNQNTTINGIEFTYSLNYYLVNGTGATVENGEFNTMFGILALNLTPQSSGNIWGQVIQLPGSPLAGIWNFQLTPLDTSQTVVIGSMNSASSLQIWLMSGNDFAVTQGETIYLRALITN